MQELLSKYKPYIIVVLISVILTYGMIYILTPKPKMPADYKSTIDSLVRLNAKLQIHQLKIDSTIDEYEEKVEENPVEPLQDLKLVDDEELL